MSGNGARPAAASGAAYMRQLRRDHAGLSRVLRTIDSLLDRLSADPETVLPILVDAFAYLLGYQHAFHHPREDRLFARIQLKRPALQDTLNRLEHDHDNGEREAARLAQDLAAVAADDLRGSAAGEFVQRIRDYVVAARVHMRDEEAVFYVRAETALTAADWSGLLTDEQTRDPLTDLSGLARDYPELAAYLDQPVRHLGQAAVGASDGRAWRRPLLALTDLYGGLLHEGVDLTRRNLGRLLAVRGPIGLVGAVGAISSDNVRFAGRCVARPSRWAFETATGLLNVRQGSDTDES